jgi:hypothetical protein
MADTKISALASAGTLADADVLALVNGGNTTKVSLNTLTAYFEQRGRQTNAAVAQQTFSTTAAYVTGSDVAIPASRLQAKSMYRVRFEMTKTSTTGSVSAPIVQVKWGTAATTADSTLATLTFAAQTAVADVGWIEIFVVWRTVGSGTSAVIRANGVLDHQLQITGLSTLNTSLAAVTSAGFDSTLANARIGVTFNGGTSFAGTTNLVQAELFNLA